MASSTMIMVVSSGKSMLLLSPSSGSGSGSGSFGQAPTEVGLRGRSGVVGGGGVVFRRRRSGSCRMAVVRAAAEGINPQIRKEEDKVVDTVIVTELSKPVTAYCRCWRSGAFPLCDGSHVKHNKATGDNIGPLLLKKQ